MSKASIDTSLTESLVFQPESLELGEKIRIDLVRNFSGCWFFLYKHTFELYVVNEYGGKIKAEILQALQERAGIVNASFAAPKLEAPPNPIVEEAQGN